MISDMQIRQQALTPYQSYIVQAPAGSGKTSLLVYRILTLLLTVEKPEQILAITFTNKATSEMRHRLLELLEMAAKKINSDDAFEQQGIELAQKVLQHDIKHQWNLLQSPQQLQILTIDAFCAKLTGGMPWLSRLGDKARTTKNADEHYAAAVDQLFTVLLSDNEADASKAKGDEQVELATSLKTVMTEFDFDYRKAKTMFITMLAKRDQWLRHLVEYSVHNNFDKLRPLLEQTWQDIVHSALNELEQLIPQATLERLLSIAKKAGGYLEQADKTNIYPTLVTVTEFSNNRDVTAWKEIKSLLVTKGKNPSFRKPTGINIKIGFPKEDAEHKNRLHTILDEFADDETLRQALAELDNLPNNDFSDQDWQQLSALKDVLMALAAFLQLRFRSVGECDFNEVSQRANLALQELENPTDLALRMDYQIQHILIDEFQDTSHSQIEILKKLTLGWNHQDEQQSQTLFLVGDPMQSIYRFREADVSLFLRVTQDASNNNSSAPEKVFDNLNLSALQLTENFRSNKNLVGWFNDTFEKSFPAQNEVMTGAISYARATSNKSAVDDYIDLRVVTDKQHEATEVINAIQIAAADLADKKDAKIAILVRSRGALTRLLPALVGNDIAYIGIDLKPLNETPAIIDILSLCKAISRLDNRIAWLALLRSPWCGLTLKEIKLIVSTSNDTENNSNSIIWEQLLQTDLMQLSDEAQARITRFIQIIEKTLTQKGRVPLHSILRWTWKQLGGESTLLGASDDDVSVVFDLIAGMEKGGEIESIVALEKNIEKCFAQPSQSNKSQVPVIISTIHKSKGLQYDTVILPNLASPPRSATKEPMMWAEDIDKNGEARLLLAPLALSVDKDTSTHYQYLRELEAKRELNQTIRLMYVACTRAERKLVLIGTAQKDGKEQESLQSGAANMLLKEPKKSSLLASVWTTLESKFTVYEHNSQDEELLEPQLSQQLHRLPRNFKLNQASAINWQVKSQLNTRDPKDNDELTSIKEFDWASRVAQAVGIVLHDWLQFNQQNVLSFNITPNTIEHWKKELLALQVPSDRIGVSINRLQTAIENIQADPQAKFIFEDYPQQQNELALSTFEAGLVKTYRIDRTFIDDNDTRWIVDYKTTYTQNENVEEFVDIQVAQRHKKQLDNYGKLMSQMEDRPIKLALYFPLLKQLRSWDYQ